MIVQMFRPNLYHGKTPWNRFEGWYFKLVNRDATEAVSIIPGVFWGKNKGAAHSFLQILDSPRTQYTYHAFPAKAFTALHQPFTIHIGNNRFSLSEMELTLDTSEQQVLGKLNFSETIPWDDRLFSPGSMGPFNFIPFLECYSQVCAMNMKLSGQLRINQREYNFDGGQGYVEKNWGSAFPYAWIWVQSNHFSDPSISLSCSIAQIPLRITQFTGFLIALHLKGKHYAFTTMNRTALKIFRHEKDVEIHLENQDHRLRLITTSSPDTYMLCRGPATEGIMKPLVAETLQARVSVELSETQSGRILLQDEGLAAGIEYGGAYECLLDEKA